MPDETPAADPAAEALARADHHFANAVCGIVADLRQAPQCDPERVALELEFALRGCYWVGEGEIDDRLRERAAALLALAGGTTTLEIEHGPPPTRKR